MAMDGAAFLQKRTKRHMARLLEQYERLVAPHLSSEAHGNSEAFKGIVRDTLKEMTGDGCDVIEAVQNGEQINEAAVQVRDRLGAR